MNKTSILFILLILVPAFSSAQPKPWSFRQCLDTALNRNIVVNQTRMSNELNKITLEQVKANRIPSVSANANEALNMGKNVDPTTNSPSRKVTSSFRPEGFSPFSYLLRST